MELFQGHTAHSNRRSLGDSALTVSPPPPPTRVCSSSVHLTSPKTHPTPPTAFRAPNSQSFFRQHPPPIIPQRGKQTFSCLNFPFGAWSQQKGGIPLPNFLLKQLRAPVGLSISDADTHPSHLPCPSSSNSSPTRGTPGRSSMPQCRRRLGPLSKWLPSTDGRVTTHPPLLLYFSGI